VAVQEARDSFARRMQRAELTALVYQPEQEKASVTRKSAQRRALCRANDVSALYIPELRI
jgi:hypothetical protein